LSFKTGQLSPRPRRFIHKLLSQLIKDGRRQNAISVCYKLNTSYDYKVLTGKRGDIYIGSILKQTGSVKTLSTNVCSRALSRQDVHFGRVSHCTHAQEKGKGLLFLFIWIE